MELPVLLAEDTTKGWNQSDTVLGKTELAFEIAGEREDGSPLKHMLLGDGKPVGPAVERLRVKEDIIKGLPEKLITYHDNTLAGKGTIEDPLTVVPGSLQGITTKVNLLPDGLETVFELPGDFLFEKVAILQINGLGQEQDIDYTLDGDSGTITFAEAPEDGDIVVIYYTRKED